MNKKDTKLKGFSLFELLLTMAILLVITVLVFPITLQKTQRSKLESYASQLATDLYYQQQRSFLKGIPSGIALNGKGYVIFDGVSLSTATETQPKSYPSNISLGSVNLTSGSEILFFEGEFKPSTYGTLIISNGRDSVRVYINREGLIGYEML